MVFLESAEPWNIVVAFVALNMSRLPTSQVSRSSLCWEVSRRVPQLRLRDRLAGRVRRTTVAPADDFIPGCQVRGFEAFM